MNAMIFDNRLVLPTWRLNRLFVKSVCGGHVAIERSNEPGIFFLNIASGSGAIALQIRYRQGGSVVDANCSAESVAYALKQNSSLAEAMRLLVDDALLCNAPLPNAQCGIGIAH